MIQSTQTHEGAAQQHTHKHNTKAPRGGTSSADDDEAGRRIQRPTQPSCRLARSLTIRPVALELSPARDDSGGDARKVSRGGHQRVTHVRLRKTEASRRAAWHSFTQIQLHEFASHPRLPASDSRTGAAERRREFGLYADTQTQKAVGDTERAFIMTKTRPGDSLSGFADCRLRFVSLLADATSSQPADLARDRRLHKQARARLRQAQ